MNNTLIFTDRVLRTIRTLPTEERIVLANAIARDIILGAELAEELPMTPVASMIYPIIRFDIEHDSLRLGQRLA